ncbi:hypothetical protein HL653_22080 [Sphingomonas sp. AP4-R1]|uniref:HEPN domain-containing protein n=1 Tax=Sphingomonas sp. AP4-R1 TaxID=2735134 RepID=UPI001493BB30|nr:HEPN domain-containing protein [Sphingomonas sp. AP4-R1]QJU60063.1 hypothetical protein HL653_22080 [Sphingomonas sp. AP4-R1]
MAGTDLDDEHQDIPEGTDGSDLRPNESIQKILISAVARFTGEFSSPNLLITHAWPPFHSGRRDWFREDTPLSRTAFVLSFRTVRSPKLPGFVVPNYEPAGQIVGAVLSVLFGKRFDTHGPIEMSGSFGVPDLSAFSIPNNPSLPHIGPKVRADYPVPLEVSEARRMQPLFLGDHPDAAARSAFMAAARFYQRALQAIEDDPEVAYLHLITAGEIIANHKPFVEEEHIDEQTRAALARIEREMDGGAALASQLRGKLRGIKRRFVSAVASYIDPGFFDRTEAIDGFSAFRSDNFTQRLAAAYDLRSKSVHTGRPFGSWIAARSDRGEVQSGEPVVEDDRELARILYRAPTFVGLERVLRYALIGFAQELGAAMSNIGVRPDSDDNG